MKTSFYIKCLFLLLLMQSFTFLSAQNNHSIDSLQNLIKTSQNDTVKIAALIQLSFQYQDYNSDVAFEYGLQALTLSIKLNHKKSIAMAHNNLGDLYWYKADYESSYDHYSKALKIYENLKDKAAIADCYRNMGWTYFSQKKYDAALYYYSKALAINQELNNSNGLGKNYNDIGLVYDEIKKYNVSLIYYQKALKIQEEEGNKQGISAIYGNMSLVYDKLGKINLAIQNNEKSLKIAEEIGNKRYLADSYCNMGKFYTIAKKFDEADSSLQKSVEYAKEINDKSLIKNSYDNFSKLYVVKKDFPKAFKFAKMSTALTDSIFNENNSKQLSEMTAKYESEKKELTIDNLKKDNELSEEKLHREKNFKIYLLIFSSLIFAFVFVLFRENIQKRKTNLKLSLAYEEIENKNKDITDSINYSKRIQEASLSPKELLYKLFSDAFVFFKPKDIVSGDFYWFAEKNGKKLIAACDCTGHGVPGALMSMIGNNFLNRIVNERGVTAPDEILFHLHKEIRKALNQGEQNGAKDGMDIALITIENETEIEFAGAQRPLWIIKKNDSEEVTINNNTTSLQLTEVKADKFSIGGVQSETERKFSKHKITLSKGDSIYIFSDGFVDQFGGAEGKKFMSKRFKDLLFANYFNSMADQEKSVGKALEKWKGSREQVDDILVIGIRI